MISFSSFFWGGKHVRLRAQIAIRVQCVSMCCKLVMRVKLYIWRAYFQKGLDPLSWLRRKMCFFVRVCTHVYEKFNIEFTITSFCSLYSNLKCFLRVGRKLNNVVILVTRFWPKVDLAPFGNKLFIYRSMEFDIWEQWTRQLDVAILWGKWVSLLQLKFFVLEQFRFAPCTTTANAYGKIVHSVQSSTQ